jgi:hypothetical protein
VWSESVGILIRRALLLVVTLSFASCAEISTQAQFPQLTYAHLGKFILDVSKIEIVNEFKSTLNAKTVEHMMPVPPALAANQWAKDRLETSGFSGRRAVFTIVDGTVLSKPLTRENGIRGAVKIEQSDLFEAKISVRLEIFDFSGRRLAMTKADALRFRSVSENITLNERDKIWFAMSETLIGDLNKELENSIPKFLGKYIL